MSKAKQRGGARKAERDRGLSRAKQAESEEQGDPTGEQGMVKGELKREGLRIKR